MSQSRPGESDHHAELDPLLAFDAELAAAESPPKSVDPTPLAVAPQADDALPLHLRLDQAERSLERARIEIAALKSDLATLVTAVDDIKKRLGRRPEAVAAPLPVQVPPRWGVLKGAAVVILCLTIGAAAMWSLSSTRTIEAPEPKPIESESSVAPPVPEPIASVPTPAVDLQTVAIVAPPSFDSPRESVSAAQDRPVRQVAARSPPSQGVYVGTLSIDAAPAGEVFINRQASGRTPVRAENLRAGSHLIWIERDGYRRWTSVVSVTADRVTRVSAQLAPLPR